MRLLFVLPLVASAGLALAGDDGLDQCGGSNVEMSQCVWDHYKAADAELNQVWKSVMATFPPDPDVMPAAAAREWRSDLVEAQRAWVTFKEKDCSGAVGFEWYGGTGAGAAIGSCLYDKTRARIDDLTSRYLDR